MFRTRCAAAAALLLALAAGSLFALRPLDRTRNAKAIWMTVSSIKTGQSYYLEVSMDGRAVLREDSPKQAVTRRGAIPVQLIKDFIRETENSETVSSKDIKQHKAAFYRGEILKISAYISGELTHTEAPLDGFGEAFSYAFGELRKAVVKLPVDTAVRAFLRAELLEGDDLDNFTNKAAKDGEVPTVETYEIQKMKPLMAAIKDVNRFIPLETDAELKQLQDFINARKLYGLRTLFYLPSTRGVFKCMVVDASRRSVLAPEKKEKTDSKPARAKKR
ncbi:MAG TPA: hypothetical protein DCZ92_03325 [Elusimicrobia bacterium]|nr:MAG: hypothetical protein A2016_02970 [Elusimicrobia bacterium GWF2_62_30]HBA59849.1 hypothetical protein [Elusimicrobiota bacterium]